jgi:hypothetical protein
MLATLQILLNDQEAKQSSSDDFLACLEFAATNVGPVTHINILAQMRENKVHRLLVVDYQDHVCLFMAWRHIGMVAARRWHCLFSRIVFFFLHKLPGAGVTQFLCNAVFFLHRLWPSSARWACCGM